MIIKTIDNFLTEEECEKIIFLIEQNNTKSTVIEQTSANFNAVVLEQSRNSSTCYFNSNDDFMNSIFYKISKYLSINATQLEPLQGQKYEKDQYYKPHYDYIFGSDEKWSLKKSGNRVWTCIIYLNHNFDGGTTNFPRINYKIKPKKGMALMFSNMKDGQLENDSLHEGSDVLNGIKYIITTWSRERDYTFN